MSLNGTLGDPPLKISGIGGSFSSQSSVSHVPFQLEEQLRWLSDRLELDADSQLFDGFSRALPKLSESLFSAFSHDSSASSAILDGCFEQGQFDEESSGDVANSGDRKQRQHERRLQKQREVRQLERDIVNNLRGALIAAYSNTKSSSEVVSSLKDVKLSQLENITQTALVDEAITLLLQYKQEIEQLEQQVAARLVQKHKKTEQAVRKHHMQTEQQVYGALFNNSTIEQVVYSLDLRILDANDVAVQATCRRRNQPWLTKKLLLDTTPQAAILFSGHPPSQRVIYETVLRSLVLGDSVELFFCAVPVGQANGIVTRFLLTPVADEKLSTDGVFIPRYFFCTGSIQRAVVRSDPGLPDYVRTFSGSVDGVDRFCIAAAVYRPPPDVNFFS